MDRTDRIALLNRALHLASRSLEVYLLEMSEPLLDAKGQKDFAAAIGNVRAVEAEQIDALVEAIHDLGGTPERGSFGLDTAYYNYLSPDYVIGLLKGDLAALAKDLDEIARKLDGEPVLRDIVKALGERKRERLTLLEGIKLPERKAEMATMPKLTSPFPPPAKKPDAAAPAPAPKAG